jgi:GTP-binding protein
MPLPVVAVIGRPNVGKSTLVNRLAGAKDAIVYDEPGVTRDRTYQPAFWRDRDYLVVDTGGLVFDDDTEFLPFIREQAAAGPDRSQRGGAGGRRSEGPTAADEEIAAWLRQQSVPVLLAVNKCESVEQGLVQAAQFWELGLGEPYPVSGIHGNGTGELLDALVEHLPETTEADLVNEIKSRHRRSSQCGQVQPAECLCGRVARHCQPDISGTTRDAIDMQVQHGDQIYRIDGHSGHSQKKAALTTGQNFLALTGPSRPFAARMWCCW